MIKCRNQGKVSITSLYHHYNIINVGDVHTTLSDVVMHVAS